MGNDQEIDFQVIETFSKLIKRSILEKQQN
jgi:hypothetical protein